jgi:phosphopantothenoylcysteine synthetase/decarboxylase
VTIPDPAGVNVIHVESAREMLEAVTNALPADIAVFVAAVADWRVAASADNKIKKKEGEGPRRWNSPKTPTSSGPSATTRTALSWWSASPPKPPT